MIKRRFAAIILFLFFFIVLIDSTAFPVEKIIRYKRYEEQKQVFTYFALGGEFDVEDEVITGQAGFIIDFQLTSAVFLSTDVFVLTDDLKRYSFNLGALLNIAMLEADTIPFFGAGISLHIPTSRTLSTELVFKANVGIIFYDSFKFTIYYTTPVDYPFDYNDVGLSLGIII